jgi:hypothetical protein
VSATVAFKYNNLLIAVQFRDSWDCRLRTLVPSKIIAKATEISVKVMYWPAEKNPLTNGLD